jgi:hypothetical protein
MEDARVRIHSHFLQAIITMPVFVVFLRNFWRAIGLVYYKRDSIASWCCFFQTLIDVISGVVDLATIFSGGLSCRAANWAYSLGIAISSLCVSVCLLMREYIITDRSRWLLAVGILLILPLPSIVWIFWVDSPNMNTVDGACLAMFPDYLPWFRLILDISINSLFSIVFLRVVIQQYSTIDNQCWKELQSDGLTYLICMGISNISCALIIAFQLAGGMSEMFFFFDCKFPLLFD